MQKKVKNFIKQCLLYSSFTDQRTSEPIKAHEVPTKCWETVAIDLFGPMPSLTHVVVVVQDLASRFSEVEFVISTSSTKLYQLFQIFITHGNANN